MGLVSTVAKRGLMKYRPGEDDLLLQALVAAVGDKGLGVLVHVVAGDLVAGDLAGCQRLAVLGGDDADHVVRNLQDFVGGDGEERRVDAIGSRRNDGDLRPALAAFGQKRPRILERVAFHGLGQHAPAGEGMTVARLHNADVAAVDRRERGLVDGVLPHPKAKMDSRSECVSLQSCLAVQCDDRAIGKGPVLAEEDPLLVDDPDLVLARR